MTIQQQSAKEAKRLVSQLFSKIGFKYNFTEFEQAKQAAIVCQRNMLKWYKEGYKFGMSYDSDSLSISDELKMLKGIISEIYKLDFKK